MECTICGEYMAWYGDDIFYCTHCELYSSNIPPDLTLYDRSYCEKYRRYEKKTPDANRELQKIRHKLVTRHTEPVWDRPRLLDFGCGSGAFLRYCVGNGISARGFDINPFGGYTDVGALFGEYDVVTFWDVLEHLPDPMAVLKGLNVPLVATCTPNSDDSPKDIREWRHYYPGEHVHYFNEASMRYLLERCGYSIMEVSYEESKIRSGGGDKNILSVVAEKFYG